MAKTAVAIEQRVVSVESASPQRMLELLGALKTEKWTLAKGTPRGGFWSVEVANANDLDKEIGDHPDRVGTAWRVEFALRRDTTKLSIGLDVGFRNLTVQLDQGDESVWQRLI